MNQTTPLDFFMESWMFVLFVLFTLLYIFHWCLSCLHTVTPLYIFRGCLYVLCSHHCTYFIGACPVFTPLYIFIELGVCVLLFCLLHRLHTTVYIHRCVQLKCSVTVRMVSLVSTVDYESVEHFDRHTS